MKTNEEIVLNRMPEFSNEEVASIIKEWESNTDTMCASCKEPLSESEQEYTDRSYGDGYNDPYEEEVCCPHCGKVDPELIKMDLDLYLFLV